MSCPSPQNLSRSANHGNSLTASVFPISSTHSVTPDSLDEHDWTGKDRESTTSSNPPELTHDGSSTTSTAPDIQSTSSRDSSPLYYENKVGDYPNDDAKFLEDTGELTKKEHVVDLKRDLIFERDRAVKAEKILEQERISWKDQEKMRLKKIEESNNEYAQSNQRGQPRPPNPKRQNTHYLYDSLVDRLRECTVHIYLRRAWNFLSTGDCVDSLDCAARALSYAEELEYAPLSSLCHFCIGRAQYKQGKYDDAIYSFELAVSGAGLYFDADELAEVDKRARDAQIQSFDGSEPSTSARSQYSSWHVDSRTSAISNRLARWNV